MLGTKENGKKILVTMIGANNAIDTEYAFFDSFADENEKTVYRKKGYHTDSSGGEKYGYPFWAKMKAITEEKSFDEIVFIGTQASKWESLLSNAERVAGRSQNGKEHKKKSDTNLSQRKDNTEALEQINQYVSQLIGSDYNPITEEELAKIERYLKDLLTPEKIKREKEHESQQRHINYIKEYMTEGHLHEYEEQLSRNITLAVKGMDALETSPIEARIILIKEGRTEKENLENIIKIQQELSAIPISEITLDVTNGLRSHPMYVLAIINNISAIGNKVIPINIYYGMFDAKLKSQNGSEENNYIVPINPREGTVAPMVDLKEIQAMEKWTRAVSEFFSNGSVLQMIELLDDIRKENTGGKYEKIDKFINVFDTFSLAVNSNNLLIFEEAMNQIDMVKKETAQIRYEKNEDQLPAYVQNCLDRVILHIWNQFRIEDMEERTKYSSYMFSLANWYLQQNRLGDSVRTLQEAVITYVMEEYPHKISELLRMKMIRWRAENTQVSDVLFDAKIRKVIRDAIFEDDTMIEGREEEYQDWSAWMQEYHYMKSHIHNPDALLYNLQQPGEKGEKDGVAFVGNEIQYTKKMIEMFAEKMPRERKNKDNVSVVMYHMLEKRIDYLLDIRYNDVFISYRRSYHSDGGTALNDGLLLVTALSDYFRKKGLRVFVDKNRMRGIEGEFTRHLQYNLRNSKVCLIVLGKDAYARDFAETDEYYKEIITAVKTNMKIAVICMEDFYEDGKSKINCGEGVADQQELMKVVKSYQRIGSEYADQWRYENILSLRKCAYKEIKKILGEE